MVVKSLQPVTQQTKAPDIISTLDKSGFIPISDFPLQDFLKYQEFITFADITYTLLYAWEFKFFYRIKIIYDNPVIVGRDIDDNIFFCVIPYSQQSYMATIRATIDLLSQSGIDFILKYISSKEHDLLLSEGYELTFDRDFSDYIYDINEFINISGKKNNSKRHEYKAILKKYTDYSYRILQPENCDDIINIFGKWCFNHSCEDCIWGCEKDAFRRLLELAPQNRDNFYFGAIYLDNSPVSFGVAEKINDKYMCYHIQKNAVNINGLTYFLHYNMALEHMEIPYINWGEDMGIDGLRFNKQKYHPCCIEHKYEVKFKHK